MPTINTNIDLILAQNLNLLAEIFLLMNQVSNYYK